MRPLFLLLAAFCLCGGRQDDLVEDVDREEFEEAARPLRFAALGIPGGKPPEGASVRATTASGEVRNGKRGLAFRYVRGSRPIPVLVHTVLVRDLESIDFWIRARRETKWRVSVQDADGAVFSADTDLKADAWRRVTLKPSDFRCNPESRPRKEKLDPAKLSYNWTGFDILAVRGGKGENVVCLDDVAVQRAPIRVIEGNFIVNGTKETLQDPVRIRGDLLVANGGELTVTSGRLFVEGKTVASNGVVRLRGGAWSFRQEYRYQNRMIAMKKGRIEMEDGFLNLFHPFTGVLAEEGAARLSNVEVMGGSFTFGVTKGCSLEMEKVKRPGEFILDEGCAFSAVDCDGGMLWLRCGKGITADLKFPPGERVESWDAPAELKRTVKVRGSRTVWWGLIAEAGCDVTLRESEVRAVGMHWTGDVRAKVEGVKNGARYRDLKFDSKAHDVRLVDTKVVTWNFYTGDTARLEIRDCTFGESISFGNSRIDVFDSVCDGTGGYIGTRQDSTTVFRGGKIACQVLTHDRSTMVIQGCTVTGDVEATHDSRIRLVDTKVTGAVRELERGRVERE